MRPLAFPFTKHRFVHRLEARDGMVCLVERTNQLTGSVHWEVVVLQRDPEKTIDGHPIPAHESYPASREWGVYGWTYTTRREADEKYRFLTPVVAVEARQGSD